jgi:hypothetical protein
MSRRNSSQLPDETTAKVKIEGRTDRRRPYASTRAHDRPFELRSEPAAKRPFATTASRIGSEPSSYLWEIGARASRPG